jgi:hypothetical protein
MKQTKISLQYKIALVATYILMLGCGDNPSRTFSVLAESESFKQDTLIATPAVDVLFVIDNSGSMASSQTALSNNFAAFINKFNALGYDYQIGVTTTQAYRVLYSTDANKVEKFSRLKDGHTGAPTGVRIITPQTQNINTVFINNILQGIDGSGDERGFQSLKSTLAEPLNASFHRPGVFLAVVIVTDENDFSWNGSSSKSSSTDPALHTVQSYVDYLKTYTNTTTSELNFNVSTVGVFSTACANSLSRNILTRYAAMADATKGVKANICGDFASELDIITSQIIKLTAVFKLNRIPLENSIRVAVDGVSTPNDAVNGWTYRSTDNSVVFHGTSIPAANAKIKIDFDPVDLSQ